MTIGAATHHWGFQRYTLFLHSFRFEKTCWVILILLQSNTLHFMSISAVEPSLEILHLFYVPSARTIPQVGEGTSWLDCGCWGDKAEPGGVEALQGLGE